MTTQDDTPNMPLAGITMLVLGQVYQGPYATMLMARAGADVIKVEPPNYEPVPCADYTLPPEYYR